MITTWQAWVFASFYKYSTHLFLFMTWGWTWFLLFPLHRWGNWDSERLSSWPQFTQAGLHMVNRLALDNVLIYHTLMLRSQTHRHSVWKPLRLSTSICSESSVTEGNEGQLSHTPKSVTCEEKEPALIPTTLLVTILLKLLRGPTSIKWR